jgi:anti-repressor protein
MNTQLIPVASRPVGSETIPTVNARELHTFLEVKTAFKDWIARRIEDFCFVKEQDFCSFLSESAGGRPTKEYALTLDMAKELSMVERNAKGKQARQYFIDCERFAKQAHLDPMQALNDPAAMRGLLLTYTEKVIGLETQVVERDKIISCIQPQAQALQRLSLSDGSLCITDAAKTLQIQPKKLFTLLREQRWIYQRVGCSHWVGYQDKLQSMVLEHKVTTLSRNDGSEKITEQVRITPKGLSKLALMFQGGAA